MRMKKAGTVLLIAVGILLTACSHKKTTVGLDVNVYLHPSSSEPSDVLLQTAIAGRLSEDPVTAKSLIHVRVEDGMVVLTGAAKPDVSKKAEAVARDTKLKVNENDTIVPKNVVNRIDTE